MIESKEPVAPPIIRGEMTRPPHKSVWPSVLGILAIIFGVGGLLQGVSGLAMLLLPDGPAFFMRFSPQAPDVSQVKALYGWPYVIMQITVTLLAALLLAGGIGLVRRRRWSATVSVIWSIVKIIATVGFASYTYLVQQVTFEMSGQAPNMPANFGMFGTVISVFSFVVTILWGWALPVFLLIWFSRVKIKSEMKQWNT